MILSRRTAPVSSFQIPQVPRLPTKRPALSLVNGQVDRVQPHALKLNRIGPDLEPEWTFVSGTVVAADQKRLVVSPQANFGRLPHPLLARYMDRDRVSCSAKSCTSGLRAFGGKIAMRFLRELVLRDFLAQLGNGDSGLLKMALWGLWRKQIGVDRRRSPAIPADLMSSG